MDKIADRLGTPDDNGSNDNEAAKMPRLAELTSIALRGFGTFATNLRTGVYGPDLECALKRHPLSSKPTIRDAEIRAPPTNRTAEGAAFSTWRLPSARYADD